MTAALRRPGGAPKPTSGAASRGAAAPATPGSSLSGGEERDALAWTHTARFFITAAQLNQLPAHDLPEIAFVGRSNAGKSTAINTLAHQRQLAFASKTPGRTQHINLFAVGPKEAPQALWADLPGYGYAAVERAAKERWQEVMAEYLAVRRNLGGVVQMVDARHGFTALDLQLLDYVAPRVRTGEVRLLVLLTKADKLNRRESTDALRAAQEVLGGYASDVSDIGVTLFSALKGTGVGDAAVALREWAQPAVRSAGADGDEVAPADGANDAAASGDEVAGAPEAPESGTAHAPGAGDAGR